jgi:hypothetical protein
LHWPSKFEREERRDYRREEKRDDERDHRRDERREAGTTNKESDGQTSRSDTDAIVMTVRREHTDAEIQELADQLRAGWSEGQFVRSWLRAHAEELQALVRDHDWKWANVGKALNLAGIAYQTGNAWSGENLRRAVDLARKPTKLDLRRARRQETPLTANASKSATIRQDIAHAPPADEFRIVGRRSSTPKSPSPTLNPSSKEHDHE